MKKYQNKKVIMILDNVRYHHSVNELIEDYKFNLEFMFLPPYSSELNAIEHLWKDIRKDVTHNTLFDSLKETFEAIKKYFMNVQRNPAKIRRMCAFIY